MKRKRLCNIIVCILCAVNAAFSASNDSIYQGMIIKLDLATPALTAGTSKGKMQHYELAMNWRVIQRLYPTLELGYAGGTIVKADTINYRGQGGFARVGLDLNPLKKHPESPHALLIGVRLGTAVQTKGYADCWGEITAGCQVEIVEVRNTAFYMGWMGRLKCLFTRGEKYATTTYIPGFGNRDNIGWGVNYFLGWRF